MEFKGTKGKWKIRGSKIFIEDTYLSVAEIHVQSNYEPITFKAKEDIEAKANALLISKAPQMLEMLSNVKDYLGSDIREEVEQLIKECTEL